MSIWCSAPAGSRFRTAPDLAYLLANEDVSPRRLSRAGLETLAIVAYHQPVTRAEIEDIRGVAVAKGTLDALLEAGFVRMRGRRKTPGRPITYGTTPAFLDHFGLDQLSDLPGLDELKGAGLIEGRVTKGFTIPAPRDDDPFATMKSRSKRRLRPRSCPCPRLTIPTDATPPQGLMRRFLFSPRPGLPLRGWLPCQHAGARA